MKSRKTAKNTIMSGVNRSCDVKQEAVKGINK